MKALILAAGFGTRLKEIGITTPKGLIKQQQKPLLHHICQAVVDLNQVDEIALVTNNRYASQYQEWLHQTFPQIKLLNNQVNEPENRLGALGDLHRSTTQLGWLNEPVLVLPSDTYFEFDLNELITLYQQTQSFVTVVRKMPHKSIIANRLGCAILEGDEVVSFIEKPADPPSLYAAIPFYLYTPQILQLLESYLSDGNDYDSPGSIIGWLIQNKHTVKAVITSTTTLDVGTPADVEALQEL